jgi:glycerol uptake facilitator-like aquaporin
MENHAPDMLDERATGRALMAEFLGTAILVCAVVGSGIMGTLLTNDIAVTLLINTVSTIAALGVAIWLFQPISGAHFNPAVTLIAAVRKEMAVSEAGIYMIVQILGAVAGVVIANIMFELPVVDFSTNDRSGYGLMLSEVLATAGLLFIIVTAVLRERSEALIILVPAWIGAAYFFSSSTSFANPAVTIGRTLTDTFTGISPANALPFIAMQIVGALLGAFIAMKLAPRKVK